MKPIYALLLAAIFVAGCGGASPGDTATGGKGSGKCGNVTLGKRDDGSTVRASIDKPTNVDCATASKVVREWGRQQVGISDAHLPAGWSCNSNSVCRNGKSSVTLTLIFG